MLITSQVKLIIPINKEFVVLCGYWKATETIERDGRKERSAGHVTSLTFTLSFLSLSFIYVYFCVLLSSMGRFARAEFILRNKLRDILREKSLFC